MGPVLVTQAAHRRLQNAVSQELLGFHAAQPLRPGMPREALRSRLALNPAIFQALLATLRADGVLVETASEVALAGHRLELTEQQSAAAVATIQALDSQPFSPPLLGELAQRYGLTPALIQHLINQGEIVRVSDEVVFSREAVSLALARFRTYLGSSPGLSVAAARDLLGSSRRYVLPLLEWLDAQRITRRVGDDRILRT
jgi:selenocysteine-specific elongation factor